MSKTRMNINKDSENTDCFDKKKRSLNNLKMFVKRSCKPELITNINDTDIEEEIECEIETGFDSDLLTSRAEIIHS